MSAAAPPRPILRWHGGKWLLAPWIIAQFPPHHVYVEPFGGAWSVGFRKARAQAEVWNDLDAELVNLFAVLRDGNAAAALLGGLRLTPFARDEFNAAYHPCEDPAERARRLIVRSFMGHGSDGVAAIKAGRRFVGIEQNPKHFETAVQRLTGAWQAMREAA